MPTCCMKIVYEAYVWLESAKLATILGHTYLAQDRCMLSSWHEQKGLYGEFVNTLTDACQLYRDIIVVARKQQGTPEQVVSAGGHLMP